ncbi:MAG: hypothetical protein JWP07_2669, partial [Pseudonocardiales bacterium]|nr:hypothetical protein [Pseudonocardiales bacterium]
MAALLVRVVIPVANQGNRPD